MGGVTRTDIKQLFAHAKRERAAREKFEAAAKVGGGVHRGTSNRNDRGNTDTRRRRREWLVETYRANIDMTTFGTEGEPGHYFALGHWLQDVPACRCYRCGKLLTADTVTVDRIIPGAKGGTYRRDNIRPACGKCNSETGATVRSK